MKKVVVIGLGYVGLPLFIEIAKAGFSTIGFDINEKLVKNLKHFHSHVSDVSNSVLEDVLSRTNASFTFDPDCLSDAEIILIAVPTPLDSQRNPDISYLLRAAKIIGENSRVSALIINESTSFPGTLRNVIKPEIEKFSKFEINHRYAISPERVDPNNSHWHINNTPRVVSGLTEQSAIEVESFYKHFCSNVIVAETPEIAEAAKVFENTFRLVNIALVNQFAIICRALDIPVHAVLKAAETKPYGFMKFSPGLGVGGHCIPIDPTYLDYAAGSVGEDASFIKLANKINLDMPKYILQRILEKLGEVSNRTILICGVSYKSNISDTRESPAAILSKEFQNQGAIVKWYDPLVEDWSYAEKASLSNDNFDVAIINVLHKQMDVEMISNKASYVFDITGLIPGLDTL